jgi:transposase
MGRVKRQFTTAFKQQVVEEVLSQRATAAQVARKHSLSGGQLGDWIDQYEEGRLGAIYNAIDDDPVYMRARIAELERLIGQLSVENERLKKANRFVLERRRESSSVVTAKILKRSARRADSSASLGAPIISGRKR